MPSAEARMRAETLPKRSVEQTRTTDWGALSSQFVASTRRGSFQVSLSSFVFRNAMLGQSDWSDLVHGPARVGTFCTQLIAQTRFALVDERCYEGLGTRVVFLLECLGDFGMTAIENQWGETLAVPRAREAELSLNVAIKAAETVAPERRHQRFVETT